MGHALVRRERNIVTRLDKLAIWETDGVSLDDFLCKGLRR